AWFIECASACTAGGALSPAMTTLRPRCACKSRATASSHAALGADNLASVAEPAPTRAASAPANVTISLGASGRRWSATEPVVVGVVSTAYSLLISPLPPRTRRRAANSRDHLRLAALQVRKS